MTVGSMIVLLTLVITLLVILVKSIQIVRSHEKAVVVRLGKYLMTIEHGLYFVIPFVDKVIKVDTQEQMLSTPLQKVTTKDNNSVEVKAVVYYQVIDPAKVNTVDDFYQTFVNLVTTTMESLVSEQALTLISAERIATELHTALNDTAMKWGVAVSRVNLELG